jgi:hypothetical protein
MALIPISARAISGVLSLESMVAYPELSRYGRNIKATIATEKID